MEKRAKLNSAICFTQDPLEFEECEKHVVVASKSKVSVLIDHRVRRKVGG